MKQHTVTLDPGHGGSDPGALGPSGLKESDMALDVCKRARTLLEPYVDVVMTRDGDRFVTLSKRADIANKAHSNLFVSYHFNSAASENAEGWEIFTTRGQNNSDTLATRIGQHHKRLFPNQTQRSDWGDGDIDKEANFSVIRGANCPAVLMEGEFIHTFAGQLHISKPDNRQKMADAVFRGVLDYLGIALNSDQSKPAPPRLLTVEQRLERLEKHAGL